VGKKKNESGERSSDHHGVKKPPGIEGVAGWKTGFAEKSSTTRQIGITYAKQNNTEMSDEASSRGPGVKRISVSLPPAVFDELDRLVVARGFENRSQAISEMIHQSLTDHYQDHGDRVMAGTITLFYDESKPGLLQALAEIERSHIAEVISKQHVLLEDNHTMEVILVQGPASRLKAIADELITCKGVRSGKLTISSALIPPIHGRNGQK
jgi:CopG family transcriptional regulator, nickel-responsive regulator